MYANKKFELFKVYNIGFNDFLLESKKNIKICK